jgi:hypothetical protein
MHRPVGARARGQRAVWSFFLTLPLEYVNQTQIKTRSFGFHFPTLTGQDGGPFV